MNQDLLSLFCCILLWTTVVEGQSTTCDASLSNHYVSTRREVFEQVTRIVISALPTTENSSETTYQQLLNTLGLQDNNQREENFNKAYSEIVQKATSYCTRVPPSATVDTDQLKNKFTGLLNDTNINVNALREIYGEILCVQSRIEDAGLEMTLRSLSKQSLSKIFGLGQEELILAFVVDDTGSMGNEIEAVKRIINRFVNSDESAVTDYILNTFNDPEVGVPVKYDAHNPVSLNQLLIDVQAIVAHGGGDCPELGMTGLVDTLGLFTKRGNIILLTDASAKDFNRTNEVIRLAANLGVCIHTIFSRTGCRTGFEYYSSVANATNGFKVYDLEGFDILASENQRTGLELCSFGSEASNFEPVFDGSTKRCDTVDVSELTKSLSFTINPLQSGGTAHITIEDPNGNSIYDQVLSSLSIVNATVIPGQWTICILSGEAEIRHNQEIHFDISAEFLVLDEATGFYYTVSKPPDTRGEVVVLLFTSMQGDLSQNETQIMKIVSNTGEVLQEHTLLQCDGFMEGRYTVPAVEHKIVFSGADMSGAPLNIDIGEIYPPGPLPEMCTPACENGGTCINGTTNACMCPVGFTGDTCGNPTMCSPSCNNGICIGINKCMCNFGYRGKFCNRIGFGPCVKSSCKKGETCKTNLQTKKKECFCQPPYDGECSKVLDAVENLQLFKITNRALVVWKVKEKSRSHIKQFKLNVYIIKGETEIKLNSLTLPRTMRAYLYSRRQAINKKLKIVLVPVLKDNIEGIPKTEMISLI